MTKIKITIEGGFLQDVEGMPEGWTYELNDLDNQEAEKTPSMQFKCPQCHHKENWGIEDFADKGNPVCPNDDSDMERV